FYVSVRDTGPGISADDQARLFQEFQQADNAITKKKGGTGLGLAISKRIIESTAGKSGASRRPAEAPPLPSRSRSSSSGRWWGHKQTHFCRPMLQCMSPLLAQSGHPKSLNQCPLLGVKRTSQMRPIQHQRRSAE